MSTEKSLPTMQNNISIIGILKSTFPLILSNKGYLSKAYLVNFLLGLPILIVYLAGIFIVLFNPRIFEENMVLLVSAVVFILFFVFVYFMNLTVGIFRIYIGLVDNKKLPISSIYKNWKFVFKFLAVNFLTGISVLGGLLLLVIPGIYIAMRLMFAQYAVIDLNLNLSAIQSYKYSWGLTKGRVLKIFLFLLTGMSLIIGVSVFARLPIFSLVSQFNDNIVLFIILYFVVILIDIIIQTVLSLAFALGLIILYRKLQQSKKTVASQA